MLERGWRRGGGGGGGGFDGGGGGGEKRSQVGDAVFSNERSIRFVASDQIPQRPSHGAHGTLVLKHEDDDCGLLTSYILIEDPEPNQKVFRRAGKIATIFLTHGVTDVVASGRNL